MKASRAEIISYIFNKIHTLYSESECKLIARMVAASLSNEAESKYLIEPNETIEIEGGSAFNSVPSSAKVVLDASLEEALDFINEDELVEITPDAIRLRKRYLTNLDRRRYLRTINKTEESE